MSEYQYYAFLALDRSLTEAEQRALRRVSSRADITATHFQVDYSWSDLRANYLDLLARYFDVHVYAANWGTRIVAFRLPAAAANVATFQAYHRSRSFEVRRRRGRVILVMSSDREPDGEWVEGGSWLSELTPIRAHILEGNLQGAYLAWLAGLEEAREDEESLEPPVPAGLSALAGTEQALAEFLRVDPFLLEAAAERSAPPRDEPADLRAVIAKLGAAEKDGLLLSAITDGTDAVRRELRRRARRRRGREARPAPRTVGALQARADELRRAEAEKAARRRAARRGREAAAAARERARELEALAARASAAWQRVGRWVERRTPKAYDDAVALLVDLRDLAVLRGAEVAFEKRVARLEAKHAKKTAFLRRLEKAGLRAATEPE